MTAPDSPVLPSALPSALAGTVEPVDTVTTDRDDDLAWSWPLEPVPGVLRGFDPPETRYARGHRGVDLAATDGQAVGAVDAGTVTHSGMVAGRGTVTVRHAGGLESTYEPLEERVPAGSVVAAGTALGVIGGPGHCAGSACLHLGARLGGDYLDPLVLLDRVRIVLLPLLG
jgi:murein DD-endopeptidase MepM/ murein hydrolase activator NlpD